MNYIKPELIFEDSGTVDPKMSYHIELENVINTKNQDIKTMVDLGRYFSIFAPRQSGKTTYFEDFCHKLKKDPTYIPILLSFQEYKELDKETFYDLIQEGIYEQLLERLEEVDCEKVEAVRGLLSVYHITNHISLRKFFEKSNKVIPPKRIIIFIDEFDGIPMGELENFLTSIRELYQKNKTPFGRIKSEIAPIGYTYSVDLELSDFLYLLYHIQMVHLWKDRISLRI